MHYVTHLKKDNKDLADELHRIDAEFRVFQQELAGKKFQGVDPEGDRKDWINVQDVNYRIQSILACQLPRE